MKLKDILIEKAKIPEFSRYATHKLKELKPILWEKNLDTDEIIDILNKQFEKLLVRFEVDYMRNGDESQYSAVSLNGAEFSMSGWITIKVLQDIEDFMNGNFHSYYEDFIGLCSASISHELAHREQLLKSSANVKNIPDGEDIKKYLSDHRELESFAVQITLELLISFDKKDILAKVKSSNGLEELALYSDALTQYLRNFETSDKVYKLLIKKIYEILTEEDNE